VQTKQALVLTIKETAMAVNIEKRIFTKLMITAAFVFAAIILTTLPSYAEETFFENENEPIFEKIGREMNLSNLSVSSMVQDKYGFLWFGTQGGLNYYNGRSIKTFKNNPFENNRLVHNLIQTMYYDEENHELWIGTYQGLSNYKIAENVFKNYTVEEDGLSNAVVVAIEKDTDGMVWIGTLEGLNRLDPESGDIANYDVPGDVVRDLLVDSSGRLLIGSYQGLLYFNRRTESVEKTEVNLPSPYVMQVKEFEKGIITLGLWDGGTVETTLEGEEIDTSSYDDNRVYCILKTGDGTLWTGTWGGGLFAKTKDGDVFRFAGDDNVNSLANPVVYSLLQDKSGILWIGTNGGGISKLNPRKRNYVKYRYDPKNEESLSQGKINSIFRDSVGNLWVAIYNSGVNRFDEEKNGFVKYAKGMDEPFSLVDNQVVTFLETKGNELLLGTGAGVEKFNYETGEFEYLNIIPEDSMVYALENGINDELLIGTYTDGLYIYDEGTEGLKHYYHNENGEKSLSDNLVYDILTDSRDRIWVATNNGLNLMKPGEDEFRIFMKKMGYYSQIASNTIRCLFQDSKERIWIGTVSGGVALYNESDETFKSYTESEGMPGNTVISILEGDDGMIWMATQNGIAILNPENGEIFKLTPEDGIGFWEFNSGHFADKDGSLLFGGIDGITSIPSSVEINNYESPSVYITGVNVRQKEIDPNKQIFNGQEIELSHEDNLLSFDFVALDYDSPYKIKFLYKLQGFEDSWNSAETRNYVSYSNLSPGKYEFIVKAETFRGVSTETANFIFTIQKPWYMTFYAYSLFVLIFFGIVLAAFKIRESYVLNAKNSELSVLNNKLEETNNALEKASIRDHLTGVYNRGYFDVLITQELDFAKRSNSSISLIMFDVDNFKDINDTFGHLAGDDFLVKISDAIASALPRSTDTLTRFGGDEFAVVLYDTDKRGSTLVAERIIKAFEEVSTMPKFTNEKIRATLSIGVVSIKPNEDTTTEMLLEAADSALYEAKRQGKNRICIGK